MTTANVLATVSKRQVFLAFIDMTVDARNFDHREWSLYEAEVFEKAAKMIRDGYDSEKSPQGKRGIIESTSDRDLARTVG